MSNPLSRAGFLTDDVHTSIRAYRRSSGPETGAYAVVTRQARSSCSASGGPVLAPGLYPLRPVSFTRFSPQLVFSYTIPSLDTDDSSPYAADRDTIDGSNAVCVRIIPYAMQSTLRPVATTAFLYRSFLPRWIRAKNTRNAGQRATT